MRAVFTGISLVGMPHQLEGGTFFSFVFEKKNVYRKHMFTK